MTAQIEHIKKYLLFGYDYYYPSGGINDYRGSFDSVEEAKSKATELNQFEDVEYDAYQIVDRDTMEKLFRTDKNMEYKWKDIKHSKDLT